MQTFLGQGGILQMRTSAIFGAKLRIFGIYMVCPHGQGGRGGRVEPMRKFCEQGGRKGLFLRFCADVLYGRPLSFNDLSSLTFLYNTTRFFLFQWK